MSAPDTNIERQARRHRGALYGIAGAIAAAAIFAVIALTAEGVPAEDQAAGVPPAVPATE